MLKQHGKRAIQAWFSEPEVARIDLFRRGQDDPSWAEAIRKLVERGLAASDEPTAKVRKRPAAVRQQRAAATAGDLKLTTEELQEDCAA